MDGRQMSLVHRSHSQVCPGGSGASSVCAPRFLAVALVVMLTTVGMFSSGCHTNPATGEEHINLISESQEIQMGQQADQEIVATMGMYPDEDLQRWIQQLGAEMAQKSERPDLPWTFRVIDDLAVNAFALPGGFIYITRGLMTHVGNEAELAGVVGHEIGHVTAQHSVHRMSSAQLTQLGLGVGMILKPELQKYGNLIGAGMNLLFLKFSRDDERQADDLGLRYMVRAQYDPQQMPGVFEMLERVSQASGGGGMPEWLATHPNPGNRRERMIQALDSLPKTELRGEVGRQDYLNRLDGMTYGADPREGYFRDGVFYQPQMRFQVNFPRGWNTINQKQAVAAISQNQDAILQITLAEGQSSSEAARAFFSQQGLQATAPQSGNVNGLQATSGEFRAATEQGNLHGLATFIEYGGNVFQMLGYTSEQGWRNYGSTLADAIRSFRELNDPERINVQPQRIKIVRVQSPSTLAQLARQHNSPVPASTLALLNQTTDENTSYNSGDLVKMVVGEKLE